MAQHEPHPLNARGDFYVEDQMCIICGVPETEAPDLMSHTEDGHCYFKKQPTTPEELDQAINAVVISCCGAVQYGGNDPKIIQEIKRREGPGAIVSWLSDKLRPSQK